MYFQVILARNFFRTILKTKCVKYAKIRIFGDLYFPVEGQNLQ